MSESSDDEVNEDQLLELINIETLKGQWEHQHGASIRVIENRASFEGGETYTIEEDGSTVTLDGWKAVPEKSTANKIFWVKGEEQGFWSFEGEIAGEDGKVDDEGIDSSNIVSGKRRRTNVDYKAILAREKEMAKKRKQAEGGSGGGGGYFDNLEDTDDSDEGDEEEEEAPAPGKPAPAAVTLEDVKKIAADMTASTDLLAEPVVSPLLNKLSKFKMTIDVLKETKVGLLVNKYRKHSSQAVKDKAIYLVKDWKSLLG
mmetsp:Transcript_36089/g.70949  ORF Transcript_36089/g.70949 Transcript_36089/m.70949 type:complete len:258 (-) Transcript_36089:236-1009(-)|eukprot:CAMPEP_0175097974 /NCGR_PEP_ID=MMETSP0086_2-20121207/5580_1 /TAXON_ID=136419 /ORGANISM="Unknown Unknown, Strain D1" /LENGTH=257 /DNA_ID=CAMNT_0016371535 /DNA_START=25 /DNA_END=798 /DNA_ORIENTATION=-